MSGRPARRAFCGLGAALLAGLHLSCAAAPATEETAPRTFSFGTTRTLDSEVLGEEREIYVRLPEGAGEGDERYPVLYVLDGEQFFASAVGLVDHLEQTWGRSTIPEMIVVGLPHPDRLHDLTPSRSAASDPETPDSSGGGDLFLDHLETEVIPHIEATTPASGHRTLFGHSLGGLLVVHALLERPTLFANYLSVDPSLWWNEREVLERARDSLPQLDLGGRGLYVGMADFRPFAADLDELERRRDDDRLQIVHARSILEFARDIAPSNPSLEDSWRLYEGDHHVSCVAPSLLDGLRHLFRWYDDTNLLMELGNAEATPNDVMAALDRHHDDLERRLGRPASSPATRILRYTELLAALEGPEHALSFLSAYRDEAPAELAPYEALGRLQERLGRPEDALASYRLALERGAGSDVRARVDDLERASAEP